MRIKKYQSFVNESGVSNRDLRDVNNKVKEYLSSIYPNINEPKIIAEEPEEHEVSTELRKFYPSVEADVSKYGKLMTVSLNLDYPVRIELVNDEIKHISFVYNLIDIISESEGVDPSCVILNSFRFFDKSYKGQKNGHTGEVEDIIPKLEEVMDDCRDRQVATTFSGPVITLSFLIQP